MLKILSRLLLLGIIVVVSIVVIIAMTRDTSNYMAAINDKHHLLDSVNSPRIILVGGSNLIFSVDSEKIEKSLGLPVINTGLNAGLGLRFILCDIQPFIREGDIIVIFPEYEHFSAKILDGDPKELGDIVRYCPGCIGSLRTPNQFINVAIGLFQYTEGDIIQKFEAPRIVYTRRGFDQWGDLVTHLNQPDKELNISGDNNLIDIQLSSPSQTIQLLNSFFRFSEKAHARVFMMFPGIPSEIYNNERADYIALYDLLQTELEIPILGTSEDFIFPKQFFYDTIYHMNRIGREQRTSRIIDLLEPSLKK